MSTGYFWEGIRQVCATLLGAHHVPDHLCSFLVYFGCAITMFYFECVSEKNATLYFCDILAMCHSILLFFGRNTLQEI